MMVLTGVKFVKVVRGTPNFNRVVQWVDLIYRDGQGRSDMTQEQAVSSLRTALSRYNHDKRLYDDFPNDVPFLRRSLRNNGNDQPNDVDEPVTNPGTQFSSRLEGDGGNNPRRTTDGNGQIVDRPSYSGEIDGSRLAGITERE